MPNMNPKLIIKACRLCFDGGTHKHVAKKLKVHPTTITRWRKHELWQKTEQQLIDAAIQNHTQKL